MEETGTLKTIPKSTSLVVDKKSNNEQEKGRRRSNVETILKSQLQQLKEQSAEVEKKSAARLQGKK